MPEGILPADKKMSKIVTGLQSSPVTAHGIINRNDWTNKYYLNKQFGTVEDNGYSTISGACNTKNFPEGTYIFSVLNFAYEYPSDEEWKDVGEMDMPYAYLKFRVKVLRPPTAMKAKASKKR